MPKPSKRIQEIQERCLELADTVKQREALSPALLPLWPEGKRGTPNSFLRSALFAAIQSKDRVYLQGVILASHKKITVKFTGLQLNQEDLTLWETLVHLARSHPLGNLCSFSGHEILKALKLSTGGEQHKRLHTAITRLNACSVEITHEGKTYFGSLIEDGIKDEITSHYTIELNQKLIRLFGESQWTAIDWQQRLRLRRKPLAQALHAHYSSHGDPHPVKLSTLQELTGSRNTQAADFKRKAKAALYELVEIGFLQSYDIENDLVSVKRALVAFSSKSEGTSLEP